MLKAIVLVASSLCLSRLLRGHSLVLPFHYWANGNSFTIALAHSKTSIYLFNVAAFACSGFLFINPTTT